MCLMQEPFPNYYSVDRGTKKCESGAAQPCSPSLFQLAARRVCLAVVQAFVFFIFQQHHDHFK